MTVLGEAPASARAENIAVSASIQKQNTEIAETRRLLKPTPVKLHHVPRWFAKRLKASQPRILGRRVSSMDLHALIRGVTDTDRWLDHHGSTKFGDDEVFVSEPYGFIPEWARALDQLAAATGLIWSVEANSWWYPGHTVRIVIREPKVSDPKRDSTAMGEVIQ